MGAGTSSQLGSATPIYGAYDRSREQQTDNWSQKEVSNADDRLRPDLQTDSTASLRSFCVSDSYQTFSDETSNRDENDSSVTSRDGRARKKVRFANVVTVSGGRRGSVETTELSTPEDEQNSWQDLTFASDLLRVHMENGQIKSIRYDRRTTVVSQVIESLKDKLKFSSADFYALTIVRRSADGQSDITVQDSDNNVHDKVALRLREESDARCCLRVIFVPPELNELLARDPETFSYLYTQCCNDVIEERFAGDIKWKSVLELSSLHLLQWATDEKINRTKMLRSIGTNWDLTPFIPRSLLTTIPEKLLRRTMIQLVKIHMDYFQHSFQLKLEYLRRVARLKSFARQEYHLETVSMKFLIGSKHGMQFQMDTKLLQVAKFSQLASVTVDNRTESLIPNRTKVAVELTEQDSKPLLLNLSLLTSELDDFIARIRGYSFLHNNTALPIRILEDIPNDFQSDDYENICISGDGEMETVDKTDCSHREIRHLDNYRERQVTGGHFCRMSCGYSSEFEEVVNHLETVLPPKTGNVPHNSQPFKLGENGHRTMQRSHSDDFDAMIQAFSNVNRWLKSQQTDTYPWRRRHDTETNFSAYNGYHSDDGTVVFRCGFEDVDNGSHGNRSGCHRSRQSRCSPSSVEDENRLRNFFNLEHLSEPLEEVNRCGLQNSKSDGNGKSSSAIQLLPPPAEFSDFPESHSVDFSVQVISTGPRLSFEDECNQLLLIPPPDEFSSDDRETSPSQPPLVGLRLSPLSSRNSSLSSASSSSLSSASSSSTAPTEFTYLDGQRSSADELNSKRLSPSSFTPLKNSRPKLRLGELMISGLEKLY